MSGVEERVRVFVYGTLRVGESNHHLIAGQSRVRDRVRTAAAFHLVGYDIFGERSEGPDPSVPGHLHHFRFPAMLEGGDTSVVGEVYEVDPATLAVLDRLEEHPDFYQRRIIRLEDGEEVIAYLLPRERMMEGGVPIPSGDWMDWIQKA